MNELSAERLALLREFGFGNIPECEISQCLTSPAYAMDTKMLVQGDHATDHAYIYYASVGTSDGEEQKGLIYFSSLLSYLLCDHKGEWDFSRMLKDLQNQLDCKVQLIALQGYPAMFIEMNDRHWNSNSLRTRISDMLKLIGQLDYLLPRKRERLLAKR